MKITIPNFRKFNPRSDLKSMPWLRLQNNFYDLEDFYNSDSNTIWLFIFLLCQCAQKVSETINLSEDYMIHKSKLDKKKFRAALNELLDKGLISLDTIGSDRIRTDSYLTNEHNEHNEHVHTHERVDAKASESFNFDLIYGEYPRKEGKMNGINKLKKIIKNQDQFNLVLEASKKYKEYCLDQGTETRYIKLFSTWVNGEHWNDDLKTKQQLLEEFDRDLIAKLDGGYFDVGEQDRT